MSDFEIKEVFSGASKAVKKNPALWGLGGLGAVLLALYAKSKSGGSDDTYSLASYSPASDYPSGSGGGSGSSGYSDSSNTGSEGVTASDLAANNAALADSLFSSMSALVAGNTTSGESNVVTLDPITPEIVSPTSRSLTPDEKIADYQDQWRYAQSINDKAGMDAAHAGAESIRKEYGYSGGSDGTKYIPLNQSGGGSSKSNTQTTTKQATPTKTITPVTTAQKSPAPNTGVKTTPTAKTSGYSDAGASKPKGSTGYRDAGASNTGRNTSTGANSGKGTPIGTPNKKTASGRSGGLGGL